MNLVGRIVARGDNIIGLFFPIGENSFDGIYNVVEIMGELQIRKVGEPNMSRERFTGIGVQGLINERPNCCMTKEEMKNINKDVDNW